MLDRMTLGEVPKKHHIALRGAGGELRYEECITREGFDGPYTIVYHERRPHTARQVDAQRRSVAPKAADSSALRRRHYDTNRLVATGAPIEARSPILFNKDVVLSVVKPTESDPVYFSNGDADDLFFVLEGRGRFGPSSETSRSRSTTMCTSHVGPFIASSYPRERSRAGSRSSVSVALAH